VASSWSSLSLLLTSESSPKHSPSKTLNAALQTQTQPKRSTSSLRCTLPTSQLLARYFVLPIPNPLPYFQSTFTNRTSGHCLENFSAESFSVSPRPHTAFCSICLSSVGGGYLCFVDICVLWIPAFCGYLRFVDICVLWTPAFCGYLRFVYICVLCSTSIHCEVAACPCPDRLSQCSGLHWWLQDRQIVVRFQGLVCVSQRPHRL
jgi:hypothetical protein